MTGFCINNESAMPEKLCQDQGVCLYLQEYHGCDTSNAPVGTAVCISNNLDPWTIQLLPCECLKVKNTQFYFLLNGTVCISQQ